MLPVVGISVAIISIFMRKRSGQALAEFASAGAFATEVISGIKTVASLSAESWAVKRYDNMVRQAQRYSVLSSVLSSFSAGFMGLLFYCTYTVAFLIGSEQVARTEEVDEDHAWNPFYCLLNECGIHGSEVMV
jgi:ATP-binding cassette subfamily B (MDR/TAP) protein 1